MMVADLPLLPIFSRTASGMGGLNKRSWSDVSVKINTAKTMCRDKLDQISQVTSLYVTL